MTDERLHELLIEGTEAWKDGKPITANPYTDSDERAAWLRGWRAYRTQLKIGPGQTGLDKEVAELVWAMNRLPGIETTGSCCGHGTSPFQIWFNVTDYSARGLLTISRLLSHNYHLFWIAFEVKLYHVDVKPQVCFLLESRPNDFSFVCAAANDLAKTINQHVDNTVWYYNILIDRPGGAPARPEGDERDAQAYTKARARLLSRYKNDYPAAKKR